MFVRSKNTADKRERNGLTSFFMFGCGDADEDQIAVTLVDVQVGGKQRLHNHPEVQVYVIIARQGTMQVGDEEKAVQAGDLIYIPTNQMHGIENTGNSILSYVSAATPAFDLEEAYDRGQLVPQSYEE